MKFFDYIRGFRRGSNARLIEEEAMSDPFLADAIDGYDTIEDSHVDKIKELQTRISLRSKSRTQSGAWKIAVAAIVFIALLGGYFSLMNHRSTMLAANEYDSSYIDLYAPESYLEQKSLELTEIKELGLPETKITAIVDITNLDEVIKPIEKMNIFLPQSYAQLKEDEMVQTPIFRNSLRTSDLLSNQTLEQLDEDSPQIDEVPPPPNFLAKAASPIQVEELNNKEVDETLRIEEKEMFEMKDNSQYIVMSEFEKTESIEIDKRANSARFSKSVKKQIVSKPIIGDKAYQKYLEKSVITDSTTTICCSGVKGKVVLEFSINEHSRPSNILIKQSLCSDLDNIAIRLVENGSDWTLGESVIELEVHFK